MRRPHPPRAAAPAGAVGIARALSKLGVCSRTEGERLVDAGRVRVNGVVVRERARRVVPEVDVIEVDGTRVAHVAHVYVMLNKPRGLVTTADDPHGRATVYTCLGDAPLPFVAPVGRLDKASEGLLLLTNDARWAAALTDPRAHVDKTYHVQVRGADLDAALQRVHGGVVDEGTGEMLSVKSIALLRRGSRGGGWFVVVLDEGRNRQLRRIFAAVGLEVQRLVRVAIGPLVLGALPKGAWRLLTDAEVRALGG